MTYLYYYHIFTDEQKRIYKTIYEGLLKRSEEIRISGLHYRIKSIEDVFLGVLYDHPEIFYTSMQDYNITLRLHYTYLYPTYFFTPQAITGLTEWLEENADQICAPVAELDDPFLKEIHVYQYLTRNVIYTMTGVAQPVNAYTVAGTLLENHSVCAGIALSFKYLMDRLEVPSIVVVGDVKGENGGRHAWNLVRLDGNFYELDATWDLIPENMNRKCRYDFFNITTREMEKTRDRSYSYPVCTSDTYNYFTFLDSRVSSPEEMKKQILKRLEDGENQIYLKLDFTRKNMDAVLDRELKKCVPQGFSESRYDRLADTLWLRKEEE